MQEDLKTLGTQQISPSRSGDSSKRLFIVVGLVTIAIGLSFGFFLSQYSRVHENQAKKRTSTSISKKTNRAKPTTFPSYKNFLSLDRLDPDGTRQTILSIEDFANNSDYGGLAFYQIRDYLIIFSHGKKEIRSHNLINGETTVLTLPEKLKDDWPNWHGTVIDSTIFFMKQTYFDEEPVFYLDYPPIGEPKILVKAYTGIGYERIGARHFLKGGDGDSCYGRSDYLEFDPVTKATWPKFSSYVSCGYGTYIHGFTLDDYVLMSERVEDVREPEDGGWFLGLYENLYLYDPHKPNNPNVLISKQDMPQDIKAIYYLREKNKVILAGRQMYMYSLDERKLEFLGTASNQGLIGYSGDELVIHNNVGCLHFFDLLTDVDEYKRVEIDIAQKKIKLISEDCKAVTKEMGESESAERPFPNESLFDYQLRKLKLPDNYEVVYRN